MHPLKVDHTLPLGEWTFDGDVTMSSTIRFPRRGALAFSRALREQEPLVCAISVFTHLDRRPQEFWMDELARVLTPGGHLLITVVLRKPKRPR